MACTTASLSGRGVEKPVDYEIYGFFLHPSIPAPARKGLSRLRSPYPLSPLRCARVSSEIPPPQHHFVLSW